MACKGGKTMPKKETFARRLTQMRKAAGLSKYEVAKRSGLSHQAVAKLEGGAEPSWNTVRRLAHVLGVGVGAFEVGPVPIPAAALQRAARIGGGDQPPELTAEEDADLSAACMEAARATLEGAKLPGRKAKQSVK
jgi:transcriptional regulator with XRE-family HTH domain